MLRQQHYYTNVVFGNWNSKKLNILDWESRVGDNCLDLPERYLWNEDICTVLAILSNKLIYM